jgi:hypothetical protein
VGVHEDQAPATTPQASGVLMANDKDYFLEMARRAKPVQDAFGKPKSAKPKSKPKPMAQPSPPKLVKAYTIYQDDDYEHMTRAQAKINKKLAPKSVMGKGSPKH